MFESPLLVRLWIVGTVGVSYADFATNVILTVEWWRRGDWEWAALSLAFICITPIVLGVFMPKAESTWRVAVLSLLCLSPALSGWTAYHRVDANTEPRHGHSLMVVKFTEAVLQSLPETCLQTYVLCIQAFSGTLSFTTLPLQVASLGLSFVSIVLYAWAVRMGHVKGMHVEFPSTSRVTGFLLFVGTAGEFLARVLALVMFSAAFKAYLFALVGGEFLFKALFFGMVSTTDEGVERLFPALSGGFFNMFMLHPGPWTAPPIADLKGSRIPKQAVWILLLGFSLVYTGAGLGFPLLDQVGLRNSSSRWVIIRGVCKGDNTANCFPFWLPIFGGACMAVSVIALLLWVFEVAERYSSTKVTEISGKPETFVPVSSGAPREPASVPTLRMALRKPGNNSQQVFLRPAAPADAAPRSPASTFGTATAERQRSLSLSFAATSSSYANSDAPPSPHTPITPTTKQQLHSSHQANPLSRPLANQTSAHRGITAVTVAPQPHQLKTGANHHDPPHPPALRPGGQRPAQGRSVSFASPSPTAQVQTQHKPGGGPRLAATIMHH